MPNDTPKDPPTPAPKPTPRPTLRRRRWDKVPLKRIAIYAGGAAALVLVVVGVVLLARDHASLKPVLGGAQATRGAPELAAGEGSPVVTNPAPVGRSVPGTVEEPAPAKVPTYGMPTASRAAASVPAQSASAAAPEPTELPLPGGPVITLPHRSAGPRPVLSAPDAQPAPSADSLPPAPPLRADTTTRLKPAPAPRPDTSAPLKPAPAPKPDTTALK